MLVVHHPDLGNFEVEPQMEDIGGNLEVEPQVEDIVLEVEHLVVDTVPGVDTVQVVGSFQAVGGTVLGEGILQLEGSFQVVEEGDNCQTEDRLDSVGQFLELHTFVVLLK